MAVQEPPLVSYQKSAAAEADGSFRESSVSENGIDSKPQIILSIVLLALAVLIMLCTGLWFTYKQSWAPPGFTGGSAAASAALLIVVVFVRRYPTLIGAG